MNYEFNQINKVLCSKGEYPKQIKVKSESKESNWLNVGDDNLEQIRNIFRPNESSFINAELFAEHAKMIIDSDRSMHDYFYNLAAELRVEGKPMTLLRKALEDEFQRHGEIKRHDVVDDILSKVIYNSSFYWYLCSMIWNDERVIEMIEEV